MAGGGAAPQPKQDEHQPHPVKDQLPNVSFCITSPPPWRKFTASLEPFSFTFLLFFGKNILVWNCSNISGFHCIHVFVCTFMLNKLIEF